MKNAWDKVVYRDGKLVDLIKEAGDKNPNKVAYEFMGSKKTYREFLHEIDVCAKSLLTLGVKEDEIVCIALPNIPQAITAFYAINKIGAIASMIHPLSSENEMVNYVNNVKARTLITLDQFYGKVAKIKGKSSVENLIIASVADVLNPIMKLGYKLTAGRKVKKIPADADILRWKTFIKNSSAELVEAHKRDNKLAVILYSGGTTGKTKGVCLSNKNINCSALQMVAANKIESSDKMLSVMPIFHGNGLVVGIHAIMISGGRCVLIPRFTPESYAKDLVKHKCCYMSGVPTLYERLMNVPAFKKANLSFLKGVFSGADYLSVELERKLNAFLKEHKSPVVVRQGYGMTEGVVASSLNPSDIQKEGSIGIALPDVKMKIVEPGTDKELPIGEMGEIVMSSVTNMMCYYNDPEETDITLKKHSDGKVWIHSGDLGTVDEDGFFFFKGRIKRMIVTSGYNVFPVELENIIEGHELVARCCVVGVPDKERVEKVKACIVLKDGVEKSEEVKKELVAFMKKSIAKYAIPREIVFIDELPKTKVGKVDYTKLI